MDPDAIEHTKALLRRRAPGWDGMTVASAAKYLGVYLGPGKAQLAWDKPLLKFAARAEQWGRLGAGLLFTLKAFRVYMVSVLLFAGQLERPPEGLQDAIL